MTKLKKLLLTLAPISAVMIATPIILTSCSTNAEQNNGGGTGNGTGGGSNSGGGSDTGGSGGSGNGGTTTNPDLKGDDTNANTYTPKTDSGLFTTIEKVVKEGAPSKEQEQVEKALTGYTTLKKEDVKDAIDVWSFNKWVGVKNDKVQYISRIENFASEKKEAAKASTWDISFTYKFKVISTYDSKKEDIYAERTFEAKGIDLAGSKGKVDFTTKASLFMVDGKNMLEEGPKLFETKADEKETESVTKVKEFLNASKSSFDIRKVANDFVTNKGIKGEATLKNPVWDEAKVNQDKSLTYDSKNPTEIVMNLSSTGDPNWGNCVNTTPYTAIIKTFRDTVSYQNKFKSLVVTNDYYISAVKYGEEIKGDKLSSMIITIEFKKNANAQGEDTSPTLTLKINGFAKTA